MGNIPLLKACEDPNSYVRDDDYDGSQPGFRPRRQGASPSTQDPHGTNMGHRSVMALGQYPGTGTLASIREDPPGTSLDFSRQGKNGASLASMRQNPNGASLASRRDDAHGTFLGSDSVASHFLPGTNVDVWSASNNVWLPAVIGTPNIANQSPSDGAVLCEIKDQNGAFQGSKWVRREDALTMIRKRPEAMDRQQHGQGDFSPSDDARQQHGQGQQWQSFKPQAVHEQWQNPQQGQQWQGERSSCGGAQPYQNNSLRNADHLATKYPDPPNSIHFAPGTPVEVWRANERTWVPASIAPLAALRDQPSPAPGAVLCIYDGSQLRKWVRAEDVATCIRPRSNAIPHAGKDDYTGYSVPQTRVPQDYLDVSSQQRR